MVLGHFVALAAKRAEPKASLAWYVLAAQFADLLWPIFLALGWEPVAIMPGITRVTPLDFISYPYSHSLAMQLLWGGLLGCGLLHRSSRFESSGIAGNLPAVALAPGLHLSSS